MRYTVLTYIFGGYEQVHEIEEKDPEAEYLLITDDPNLKSDTWQVLHHPMPDMSLFARCYQVRFHPFRFAHTPMVVRVDGSIKIKKPLIPIPCTRNMPSGYARATIRKSRQRSA